MEKKVERYVARFDNGKEIETYGFVYGADKIEVLKEAWMYENGFSHADGFAEGWQSCFNTIMSYMKRAEEFGDEAIKNVKKTDTLRTSYER